MDKNEQMRDLVRAALEDSSSILEGIGGELYEQAQAQIKDNEYALAALSPSQSELDKREGWISVEDRLPEPFVEVMVWPHPTDYCMTGTYWSGGKFAGRFVYSEYIAHHGQEDTACAPTHWMPIPNPPTEAARAEQEKA